MLAALASGLRGVVGQNAVTDDATDSAADGDGKGLPPTTGKRVECWVELNEPLQHKLVTQFAAKLPLSHAHGQWLVCEWQVHEKSSNSSFTGFQKVFRKKYKPTKFKQEAMVILNSDDSTDSDPEVWAHVQKVLNDFAPYDVQVERDTEAKTMRRKK